MRFENTFNPSALTVRDVKYRSIEQRQEDNRPLTNHLSTHAYKQWSNYHKVSKTLHVLEVLNCASGHLSDYSVHQPFARYCMRDSARQLSRPFAATKHARVFDGHASVLREISVVVGGSREICRTNERPYQSFCSA
jgi:hypothetical protein